jgi:hypothetical protein
MNYLYFFLDNFTRESRPVFGFPLPIGSATIPKWLWALTVSIDYSTIRMKENSYTKNDGTISWTTSMQMRDLLPV